MGIDIERLIKEDTDSLGLTDKEKADFDIFKDFSIDNEELEE